MFSKLFADAGSSAGGLTCLLIFLGIGLIGYVLNKQKEAKARQQCHHAPQRPSFVRQVAGGAASSLLVALVKGFFGLGGHHGHHRHRH
jgi:hypothetical protein